MPQELDPITGLNAEAIAAQEERCKVDAAPDGPDFDDTLCNGMFDLDGPDYEKFLNDLGERMEKETVKKS